MTKVAENITIIGVGLIGSSLARAIKENKLADNVTLSDNNEIFLARAKGLGLADYYAADPQDAVRDADIVVLAIPVGQMGVVAALMAPALKKGTIVTDVGSVKKNVLIALTPHIPDGVHIVPGHPVAGTEQSGPDAGFADLFKDRWAILTPPSSTHKGATEVIQKLWEGVGSKVEIMDANHHDLVLAITSHVPHLIAYNIVGTASDLEMVTESEVIKYSAGGFRDFTRIAASDPTMWRDVFLNNQTAVLEMLGRFTEDLSSLQRAIRWGDGEALHDLFSRTREIRREIIDAGQDTETVDFGRPHGDEED